MKYIDLVNILKKNKVSIFTLQDIETLYPQNNPKTIKNNFTNWVKKGYFERLKRNVYECIQPGEDTPSEFLIANKLYQPSYVSRETALSFYNILPEETSQITSVTTKPTRTIKNKYATFTYKTIKKKAYNGYRIIRIQGAKTLIADKEKALADFIYYRSLDGQEDFDEERLNTAKISARKAIKYAQQLNEKTLRKVKQCFQ